MEEQPLSDLQQPCLALREMRVLPTSRTPPEQGRSGLLALASLR